LLGEFKLGARDNHIQEVSGLVSIGLPVYNSVGSIRQTLDSILSQDYPHVEVLISDNASTDGTYEILLEYASKHDDITLVRQDVNKGISCNFTAVLEMARGEYFIFYAADDTWEPSAMSQLVRELEKNSECGLVMAATKRVRTDSSLVDYIRYEGPYNPNGKSLVAQASLLATRHQHVLDQNIDLFALGLYRRRLLASIYRLEADAWAAGVVFIPAVIAIASELIYVDEVLYNRTVQDKPFQERLPDDPLSPKMSCLAYHVLTWKLLRMVLLMPEISLKRKIASLPVFPPLIYMSLRGMLGKVKRAIYSWREN